MGHELISIRKNVRLKNFLLLYLNIRKEKGLNRNSETGLDGKMWNLPKCLMTYV